MSAAVIERALRRLPSDRLLNAADALRRAAFSLDRGRPDAAMTELAAAAEILGASPSHPTTPSDALDLLDRAAFDLRQGWHAAAYDAAVRAVRMIEMEAHHGR